VLIDAYRVLGLDAVPVPDVLAVGWATVELDRAARELGAALGVAFVAVEGSVHLGAVCRRSVATVDGVHVVLLEPITEGRLAATLARHAEGWAAAWLRDDDATRQPRSGGALTNLSASRLGPFGPEQLLLGGVSSGPHRLLVSGATIGVP